MKYFLLEEDARITHSPRILLWHKKIDIRDICMEKAYKLPARELLFIESSPDTIFTDIISSPFFLVSAKIKKTIQMYEPNVILKELVLLDQTYERAERYYLPVFAEIDCMDEESVFNLNHSELKRIVMDREKITDSAIFRIAGIEKQYIVGNLDIVESILKRGCTGLQLTELEISG